MRKLEAKGLEVQDYVSIIRTRKAWRVVGIDPLLRTITLYPLNRKRPRLRVMSFDDFDSRDPKVCDSIGRVLNPSNNT